MSDVFYLEYIYAYSELLETYYGQVREELFPNGTDDCFYFKAHGQNLQKFAAERFGFLMIVGESAEAFDKYIASIQDNPPETEHPKASALALIKGTIDQLLERTQEPAYIEHVEREAVSTLGFLDITALHAGLQTGSELLTDRIEDFFEIVPMDTLKMVEAPTPVLFIHKPKPN
jgi:hypothetical protein